MKSEEVVAKLVFEAMEMACGTAIGKPAFARETARRIIEGLTVSNVPETDSHQREITTMTDYIHVKNGQDGFEFVGPGIYVTIDPDASLDIYTVTSDKVGHFPPGEWTSWQVSRNYGSGVQVGLLTVPRLQCELRDMGNGDDLHQ